VAETHLTEAIAAFAQRDCVRAITAYDAFLTTSQIEDSRRTQALNRTTFCERELRLVNRLLYDAEAAFETENCRTALGLYTRFLERVPATHEQTSVVRDRVAFCRRKLDNSGAPSARPRP